ncbi:MAG: hypothetical protein ACK45J_03550 [Acidimicrobiaceae bacterium]|nr:hypothetical protein [Ilumatobacteraceae bacterium]
MNRRAVFIGAGVALAAVFLGNGIYASLNSSDTLTPTDVLRKIDLVASVNSVNTDVGWSQEGGLTSSGAMRLALDDLRVLTIAEGTLVDDYDAVPACTDFVTPNACVLLADMLGESVVWFALVPADKANGMQYLTLPGLIDMQANGDEGILRNGWVVKLATPVKRDCGDIDTATLRDFITRFPDEASTSLVNMTTDNVVSVVCTSN